MTIPAHIQSFWGAFLDSDSCPSDANQRFDVSFRIGSTDEDADEGVRLILSGEKTATSSLLWDYKESRKPLPYVGALSVLEDGKRTPVCVIETTWVKIIPFDQIDAKFAHEYSEADGTLEGWRRMFWDYYVIDCSKKGRVMLGDAPMVCERFHVIFRSTKTGMTDRSMHDRP
jgi:uncharacterized protein YhfF